MEGGVLIALFLLLELQFGLAILEQKPILIQLVVQLDVPILKMLRNMILIHKLILIQPVVHLDALSRNHKPAAAAINPGLGLDLAQEREQELDTELELDLEPEQELVLELEQGQHNITVGQGPLVQV